jgi:toxin secretion/phage lysis holin|nr:MAG TPA: holin [Caudoviricetes sp.]
MDKVLFIIKSSFTVVISTVVAALGGFDSALELLISLILVDMISGVVYAIMQKTLSSTELRNGIMRKVFIFLAIFIALKVDTYLLDLVGKTPTFWGISLSIRTLVVIWFCIEELISLLENLANIGVPFPKWVKEVLVQVSDCVDKSTPREVIDWIKKTFNIKDKTD